MSRSKLFARVLPLVMLALWIGFAAAVEGPRCKAPQSQGAVQGLITRLAYHQGNVTPRR